MTSLRRLLRLARAPRRRVALAVALGAGTVVFGMGLMSAAGYLISRAAERPAILSLTLAIVGVRFFGLGRPLLRYADRLAGHDIALRAVPRVRAAVYAHLELLAPADLERYRDGDVLARVVADVDALQHLHLRGVLPPLVAGVAGAAAVGATAAFLPSAALALAIGLLVAALAVPATAVSLGRRATRRQAAARGELTAELVELLGAAPELAVNGGAGAAVGRVRTADRRLVAIARRDALAGGAADALGVAITGATVAAVLALAVGAAADGALDRVLVALLALLALASFEAVTPLAASARELGGAVAAGRRVLALLDTPPAVVDPPAPAPPPVGPLTVALEGVTARHRPGEPPVLRGLDLRLEPGRRLALLGPSGAGKSTVVSLLLRFLDPEEGRVTLGGTDLRDLRQRDVRRRIAVAGQDSHVFAATIRDNVRLGRPDASDADVEGALRQARLWSWVDGLPDGLDTLVGEQGRALSGGQRQRLVVARALLLDAPVLVLDEPTAHLDAPTAAALMRDVLAAAGGRSVLVITHRAEGLELVDERVTLPDQASSAR